MPSGKPRFLLHKAEKGGQVVGVGKPRFLLQKASFCCVFTQQPNTFPKENYKFAAGPAVHGKVRKKCEEWGGGRAKEPA